ncbi:MAG: rhodanese-like domain-containing protein [Halobacterium sp.]
MDGEVSADELAAVLDDDGVRVVDIRRRAAFERGHIPGSECIPFQELPQSVDRLDGAERVVTVCPHGESSVQAARLVASYEGLADDARVESLAEGLAGWPGELETEPEETTGDSAGSSTDEPADGSADATDEQSADAPF